MFNVLLGLLLAIFIAPTIHYYIVVISEYVASNQSNTVQWQAIQERLKNN